MLGKQPEAGLQRGSAARYPRPTLRQVGAAAAPELRAGGSRLPDGELRLFLTPDPAVPTHTRPAAGARAPRPQSMS